MKIKVEPLLPTGNYLNVRIGIEMDVSLNQTTGEAINGAWDAIVAIHRQRYPHLYSPEGHPLYEKIPQGDEMRGSSVRTVDQEPKDKTLQGIIEDIGNCTVLDEKNSIGVQVGLLAYEEIAMKYPEVWAVYAQKVEELTKI